MLRRLRLRRSWWAAIAAGIVAVPALLGGVAAAPADANDLLPEPDLNPRETPPPDAAQLEARRVLASAAVIADLAPEQFRLLTVTAAQQYQVDPRLLAALVTVETEWKADSVGFHGEKGLTQILASTGAWLASLAGVAEYDLADPATSLKLGALYLSVLLQEYDGSVEQALAVYNGGPRAAESAATNIYARKVLRVYHTWPVVALETAS